MQSFRHHECQNPSIISESIGIPNGSKKTGKKVRSHGGTRRNTEEQNLIHIEEDSSLDDLYFIIIFPLHDMLCIKKDRQNNTFSFELKSLFIISKI